MDISLILIACAILFFLVFISKRRFGLLALGLATGAMLNSIWGKGLIDFAMNQGSPAGDYTPVIISSVIILLPALILLLHGNTYSNKIERSVCGLLVVLLALAFLSESLGQIIGLSGTPAEAYKWFTDQRTVIIGIGLIAGVVDIFLTKPTPTP